MPLLRLELFFERHGRLRLNRGWRHTHPLLDLAEQLRLAVFQGLEAVAHGAALAPSFRGRELLLGFRQFAINALQLIELLGERHRGATGWFLRGNRQGTSGEDEAQPPGEMMGVHRASVTRPGCGNQAPGQG